jgi:glucose/arabinose dehydrogenase
VGVGHRPVRSEVVLEEVELAAGRLTAPGGVAVDEDGTVYVSNKSTSAGSGELLRIRA